MTLTQSGDKPLTLDMVFRLFDDGLGFRYEIPKQRHLSAFNIMDELTEFNIVGDPAAWWIPAWQGNRYEFLYQRTPLSQMPAAPHARDLRDRLRPLPQHSRGGAGGLRQHGGFAPHRRPQGRAGALVRRRQGQDRRAHEIPLADHSDRRRTPAASSRPYLILNLNEPCQIKKTDWIKPGKYIGIWWEMHLGVSTWGSGDRHGATTANTMRYLDFAAAHGFDGRAGGRLEPGLGRRLVSEPRRPSPSPRPTRTTTSRP